MLGYLAIIQDSYREARDSRVLNLMLAVSVITIVVVGGIGWWKTEEHTITVEAREGAPWIGMSIAKDDTEGLKITSVSSTGPAADIQVGQELYLLSFAGESLSGREDLKAALEKVKDGDEVKVEVMRPWISVFGYELGEDWDELRIVLELPTRFKLAGLVYGIFYKWIVGLFGIVIGLVVTANFMPRFLETGAIHLVMSRPVSRGGVIVARFLGGLSFMVVFTTVLIAGLTLVLSLRSGVWIPQLLWSIPLLVFTFAQFYAFSCLVSILTRSQIVTIVLSVVFYLVALGYNFSATTTHEFLVTSASPVVELVADGERLVLSEPGRGFAHQLAQYRLTVTDQQMVYRGSMHLPQRELVLRRGKTLYVWSDRSDSFLTYDGAGANDAGVIRVDEVRGVERFALSPDGAAAIIKSKSDLAVWSLINESGASGARAAWPTPSSLKEIGPIRMLDAEAEPDKAASAVAWGAPGVILGLESGGLRLAKPETGEDIRVWKEAHASEVVSVGALGATLISIGKAGDIRLWDAGSEASTGALQTGAEVSCGAIAAIGEAEALIAVGHSGGAVELVSLKEGKLSLAHSLSGLDGAVLDVSFSEDGRKLAASSAAALVGVWETQTGELAGTLDRVTTLRSFDWYLSLPYWVFPRTRQLDAIGFKLVLSGELEDFLDDFGAEAPKTEQSLTVPLFSGAAFILVVVGLGALIFGLRDL